MTASSLLDPAIATPKVTNKELAKLLSQAADLLGRYGSRKGETGRQGALAMLVSNKLEEAADNLDSASANLIVPTDTALFIERAFVPKRFGANASPAAKQFAGEFRALVLGAASAYTVQLLVERVGILDGQFHCPKCNTRIPGAEREGPARGAQCATCGANLDGAEGAEVVAASEGRAWDDSV